MLIFICIQLQITNPTNPPQQINETPIEKRVLQPKQPAANKPVEVKEGMFMDFGN